MDKTVSRLHTVWVNGGFDGEPFMQWVITVCQWIVQVVQRPEQTQGFVLLKKRWVVERTFGWLMGTRRLVRDYELLPQVIYSQSFPKLSRKAAFRCDHPILHISLSQETLSTLEDWGTTSKPRD